MNTPARLTLVLGCLVVAALELPRGAEVLAQDLGAPYCALGSSSTAEAAPGDGFHASDLALTSIDDFEARVEDDDGAATRAGPDGDERN